MEFMIIVSYQIRMEEDIRDSNAHKLTCILINARSFFQIVAQQIESKIR